MTSRGFTEEDAVEVAKLIKLTLTEFDTKADEVRDRVAALCKKHPLYA